MFGQRSVEVEGEELRATKKGNLIGCIPLVMAVGFFVEGLHLLRVGSWKVFGLFLPFAVIFGGVALAFGLSLVRDRCVSIDRKAEEVRHWTGLFGSLWETSYELDQFEAVVLDPWKRQRGSQPPLTGREAEEHGGAVYKVYLKGVERLPLYESMEAEDSRERARRVAEFADLPFVDRRRRGS
jgi:hypothetical protein